MKNSASKSEAPVSLFYYDNYKSQSYNQNDRLPITSQTLADAGPVRPDHAACQYQPDGIFSLCATSGWNDPHANCAAIALQKVSLSFSSFVFYLIFLLIHILGAHYLYSYVPYNDWLLQYFGFDLNQWLGWERNMYDRFVHFAYGVLLYPLFFRLHRLGFPNAKDWMIFLLVVQWVMSSSLIYEWLEWLLAILLSPEAAENYNGQQGDVWDAHKDMLLATLGAILAGSWNLYKDRKKALD